MTATRRTAMPVDEEGVLLKKNPFAPSSYQVRAGNQLPDSPWQTAIIAVPHLAFQIHFKQLPLRRQKGRLDDFPGVNRLHRSPVGLHLRAQFWQVLWRGV